MDRVDVRGEVCPRPALIVRRRLADLETGERLLVEGDYPPAENNLRRTCTKHGFEVADATVGDGEEREDEQRTHRDGNGDEDEDGFALEITVTEDATLQ